MAALRWIIIYALVVQVLSQEENALYSSQNYPDFYKNEVGTFTCKFTGVDTSKVTGFGLRHKKEDGAHSDYQCIAVKVLEEIKVFAEGPTNEKCKSVYNVMKDTGSGQLQISRELNGTGEYYCGTIIGDDYVAQSPKITVEQLYVPPASLNMELTPGAAVYEGDDVSIRCTSEGGNPAAVFEYGEVDGDVFDSEPSFKADTSHNGKTYYCRDKSHPNYNRGDNDDVTYRTQMLTVYYFKSTREDANMTVNPSSSVELDCIPNSNLAPNTSETFVWKKDGVILDGETTMELTARQEDVNETLTEVYECIASVTDSKLQPYSVKYSITWDVKTSTTTEKPTTTKELKKPTQKQSNQEKKKDGDDNEPTMIIIIVVVVVTIVILTVVIVIIVIKKRNSRRSKEVTKEGGQSSPKKGDAEQGTGDGDVTGREETTKLLKTQENNKSA